MRKSILVPFAVVILCSATSGLAKSVKIHGYVTAIKSPNEFEIDEYRITKDATITLEFEKSEDPQEKTTFNPEEIRVGTEMEIRGDLDEASNQLTAKAIKINLNEHQRVKRTALIEAAPALLKVGNGWEGQIQADGQRILVTENTATTIRLNNTQKKATREAEKAAKKQRQSERDSDSDADQDAEPGVALSHPDQIRGNTFVSYEGVRQKDGTILATKVEFTENELTSAEARLWKTLSPKIKESNYVSAKPGELSIRQVGKFKLVPMAWSAVSSQYRLIYPIPEQDIVVPRIRDP